MYRSGSRAIGSVAPAMSKATTTGFASRGSLRPENGDAVVTGTDFGVVASDNRLQAITGFFDHVRQG